MVFAMASVCCHCLSLYFTMLLFYVHGSRLTAKTEDHKAAGISSCINTCQVLFHPCCPQKGTRTLRNRRPAQSKHRKHILTSATTTATQSTSTTMTTTTTANSQQPTTTTTTTAASEASGMSSSPSSASSSSAPCASASSLPKQPESSCAIQ